MRQSKICQLLHNSRHKLCTRNPEQIEVTLELINTVHPATTRLTVAGVVHMLNRRRVLLTTPKVCRGEIFNSRVREQSSRGKYPYFCRYPNFLITQFMIGQKKNPCQDQLYAFSRVDTIPACDGQTRRRHIRASIASRSKKLKSYVFNKSLFLYDFIF